MHPPAPAGPAQRPRAGVPDWLLHSSLMRNLTRLLALVGLAAVLAVAVIFSPLERMVSRPLDRNDPPVASDAIVCLGGGCHGGLPTSIGLARIELAADLCKKGFAPVVVFSGGPTAGCRGLPEALVYQQASRWFGLPETATELEPRAMQTAEHPRRLLAVPVVERHGGKDAHLLIVTSPFAGKRAGMVFSKAGFRHFRVVTRIGGPPESEDTAVGRLFGGILVLREWAALAYYRLRGWI
jgi:uncharacterized SAM-binding protein YcdF (DUF218 family)